MDIPHSARGNTRSSEQLPTESLGNGRMADSKRYNHKGVRDQRKDICTEGNKSAVLPQLNGNPNFLTGQNAANPFSIKAATKASFTFNGKRVLSLPLDKLDDKLEKETGLSWGQLARAYLDSWAETTFKHMELREQRILLVMLLLSKSNLP
ncbi:hypothetical protein CEXT_249091 [Caerostris extrusa]|uniref:Uncharacterized protein n=1 Tax=Caerostris extrusa TaxID=172846 RepID=A0AAV4PMF5_CAEEX|nr:hypothetical protein CEXT_249091 [Caerostris extrusa]